MEFGEYFIGLRMQYAFTLNIELVLSILNVLFFFCLNLTKQVNPEFCSWEKKMYLFN